VLGNFEYTRIRSIDEGCRALADAKGQGAVLAGGTDLLVEIRNGLKSPQLLVDCKALDDLRRLDTSAEKTTVGASVTLNQLIENREFRSHFPALADALESIGTYQLRNRATVSGNICNGSPAADSAPVLLVLNATVHIHGVAGPRAIPIAEFFTGVKRTALNPDEIVTSITLPYHARQRTSFLKQQRIKGHDLAVVNAAGAYDPEAGELRLAIGSCAPTPVLLDPIPVDSSNLATLANHAVALVQRSVSPISDVRASAEYRNAILPVMVKRILHELLSPGGGA